MDIERVRTVIAIELPDSVKVQIGNLEASLMKARADVKWVDPANMHITLKFLGEIALERVTVAQSGVRDALVGLRPFTLSLSQLGAFPDLDRPRVLWIGCSNGIDILLNLQEEIESCLIAQEFVREARPFSPHLTIGRIRSPKGLGTLTDIAKEMAFEVSDFRVENVAVVKSQLKPGGPAYSVIERVALG